MDILKTKSQYRLPKILAIAVPSFIALLLISAFLILPQGQYKVDRGELLIGTVQRGDLAIAVDGYGVLRSYKQTLLTALTPATVEEVLLRPGAAVIPDSIILRLSNPELLQEVESAGMALSQEQANLRRVKLDNQRVLLAEQSTLSEFKASLQTVQLRLDAEQKLVVTGAVSKLMYQTTLLQHAQMSERLQLQQQRIKQLKAVMEEAILIQQEQVKQIAARYQSMQLRAERLTVRAGMEGVLQRLPVELGQSVAAGQELALVGSDKDLIALVRVSQSKAEQLQIGQRAKINTRREAVAGVVRRIAPEVNEGTVEVEIAFSEGVPSSARPELNVDARIFIAHLTNVLFIERPVNAHGNSKASLFKVDKKNQFAASQEVVFGDDAERFIQIISGAKENDQFILSDMMRFSEVNKVRLVY